uniref:Uncharacterized protein n=1 Tax=Cacopsylla melanoneura TaxID=428564 RepID=A0A8D8ZPE4_9HEMI
MSGPISLSLFISMVGGFLLSRGRRLFRISFIIIVERVIVHRPGHVFHHTRVGLRVDGSQSVVHGSHSVHSNGGAAQALRLGGDDAFFFCLFLCSVLLSFFLLRHSLHLQFLVSLLPCFFSSPDFLFFQLLLLFQFLELS